jgi:hypothetical protein
MGVLDGDRSLSDVGHDCFYFQSIYLYPVMSAARLLSLVSFFSLLYVYSTYTDMHKRQHLLRASSVSVCVRSHDAVEISQPFWIATI